MIFYLLFALLALLVVLALFIVWAAILAGGVGLSLASIASGAVLAGRRSPDKRLPRVHLALTLALAGAGLLLVAVAVVAVLAVVTYLGIA